MGESMKVDYLGLRDKLKNLFVIVKGRRFDVTFTPLGTRRWLHEFVVFFEDFSAIFLRKNWKVERRLPKASEIDFLVVLDQHKIEVGFGTG